MVARNPTQRKLLKGLYWSAEFGEVTVSNGDTVTWSNFDSSGTTNVHSYLMKKINGAAMTTNDAANVSTVTGAGTDILCVYLVYGVVA